MSDSEGRVGRAVGPDVNGGSFTLQRYVHVPARPVRVPGRRAPPPATSAALLAEIGRSPARDRFKRACGRPPPGLRPTSGTLQDKTPGRSTPT